MGIFDADLIFTAIDFFEEFHAGRTADVPGVGAEDWLAVLSA